MGENFLSMTKLQIKKNPLLICRFKIVIFFPDIKITRIKLLLLIHNIICYNP